jgi:hypothetical protein
VTGRHEPHDQRAVGLILSGLAGVEIAARMAAACGEKRQTTSLYSCSL